MHNSQQKGLQLNSIIQFLGILYIKGALHDSNAIQFWSNSANWSLRSSSSPFSVCAKNTTVRAQSWCCTWETNMLTRTEHIASETQKEGVSFYWLLNSNINNLSPEWQKPPLTICLPVGSCLQSLSQVKWVIFSQTAGWDWTGTHQWWLQIMLGCFLNPNAGLRLLGHLVELFYQNHISLL